MRNRTITYSLLTIIVLLFIMYFVAQNIVYPDGQPIVKQLNNIIQYAEQDKWAEAEDSFNKLMASWEKGKYLLAINYAEADYSFFIENLARMQGAIEIKDDMETVSQAQSTLKLWNNFIKVVPQP